MNNLRWPLIHITWEAPLLLYTLFWSTLLALKNTQVNFPIFAFQGACVWWNHVKGLISSSIREALDKPLNYARIYIVEMLDLCVGHVIYLDSTRVKSDCSSWVLPCRFQELLHWWVLAGPWIFAGVWGEKGLFFNTGVMVMELDKWRRGDYSKRIDKWMEIQ